MPDAGTVQRTNRKSKAAGRAANGSSMHPAGPDDNQHPAVKGSLFNTKTKTMLVKTSRTGKVTHESLIASISATFKISPRAAEAVVDTFSKVVRDAIIKGHQVILPNLMSIKPFTRKSYRNFNIDKGRTTLVPEMKHVRVSLSDNLIKDLRKQK